MKNSQHASRRTNRWLIVLALVATAPALAQNAFETGDLYEERDCVIWPHRVVDVSTVVPGLLDSVSVERSDEVEAGQAMARLESSAERASLELAEAWASLESEILTEQTAGALDQRREERISRLYVNRAVALDHKDEAETKVRLAGLRLRQANEKRWIRELDASKAKAFLERRIVRAAISGVVVERFRNAGEYVENQPIVRIASLHPLRVETIVPMDLFGRVEKGMRAEVRAEHDPETVHRATVSVVDRIGDAASGTFGVRFALANPDRSIPAGLKCRLRFVPEAQPASREEDQSTETAALPGEPDAAPIAKETEPTPAQPGDAIAMDAFDG